MKKIFLFIALIISVNLLGQDIMRWRKITNYASTSKMVWSYVDNEYNFIPNNDYHDQNAVWDITLDVSNGGDGMVTSGDITYRIRSSEYVENDGVPMIIMEAYHEGLKMDVRIIVGSFDGEFMIALFADKHKRVYYFYE